jgi:Domain of unknown function (DUF222)
MDSNTSSPYDLETGPDETPAGLEGLAAAIGELAARDPDELGDAALAAEVLALRRLADQLEGAWLRRLAVVDARGAAGAEHGVTALSTTGWLHATLRISPGAAGRAVRTARALHRGPLQGTARALAAGQVSVQHATVLAETTADLPPAQVADAEGVLVAAARRLDPGRLRRLTGHLREVIDPDRAAERGRARLDRRGLWLAATVDGMVAVDGLLDPEAGETVRSALLPLARPTGPNDARSAAQRRADALAELARQGLQAGRLPRGGGLRPQVTVTVELASLLAEHGVGGTGGWGGILPGESVRRLCCDANLTRAIVHRPHWPPNPPRPLHHQRRPRRRPPRNQPSSRHRPRRRWAGRQAAPRGDPAAPTAWRPHRTARPRPRHPPDLARAAAGAGGAGWRLCGGRL